MPVKLIAIFIFCMTALTVLPAQTPADKVPTQAENNIKAMKTGVLLVRLPSHHRKLTEMNKLLDKGNLSAATAVKLQARIHKTIAERDRLNRLWIKAFGELYDFSEVRFTYDTTYTALLHHGAKNSLLNEKLQLDTSRLPVERPVYLLRFGKTDASNTTRVDAAIFQDATFNDLTRPFPYYVKLNRFMYLFNKVFSPSIADPKNIKTIVEKINKRLSDYYGRVD